VTLAPPKAQLQKLLKSAGVYDRVKVSLVYDLYWYFANRSIIEDRRREIHFYRGLLRGFHDRDLIFDVGASHGYKTDIFLRLGAKVVAVEPDEMNQEILMRRFLELRLKKMPLNIVGKAVSDSCSIDRMWIDAPGSAENTLSQKWAETLRADATRFGHRFSFDRWRTVETVSLEKLMVEYGLPFFVKIDVEGHELSVLRGMQRPVPYVSFEVNLPEFRPEGLACIEVLCGLDAEGKFNYTADCRLGLALKEWGPADELSSLLSSSTDPT
jgi:FkbM family methyltransferase